MTQTEILKLNALEAEILLHRLSADDCIADALTDCGEGERPATPVSYETVREVATNMHNELKQTGTLDLKGSLLRKLILEDAIEGNTALCDLKFAVGSGQITREQAAALRRAGKSLHRKALALGLKCDEVPVL